MYFPASTSPSLLACVTFSSEPPPENTLPRSSRTRCSPSFLQFLFTPVCGFFVAFLQLMRGSLESRQLNRVSKEFLAVAVCCMAVDRDTVW